jgi:hypothetical protein
MTWQPIETAPRDGTPMLVWIRFESDPAGFIAVCKWVEHPRYPWKPTDTDASGAYATRGPTHWMPLPDPPATEANP